MISAAEFFSGMGLMRAGLERSGVQVVFANDHDRTKALLYRENWGDDCLLESDIRSVSGADMPDIDIATASFPCEDMSLAGCRAGLAGERSSLVFDFCRVLDEMEGRAPPLVLLENVPGLLSANNGQDYRAIVERLRQSGYEASHLMVDAGAFVPQSRPRVFILGALHGQRVPLPRPPPRRPDLLLGDIAARQAEWWAEPEKDAFLGELPADHSYRLAQLRQSLLVRCKGAYRRTRGGKPVWEVRRDERAGALRALGGGSSRQALVRAGLGEVDVRWMTLDEYARLQGAEHLRFGSVTEHQALSALGDAVCVPVVEWVVRNWLLPALRDRTREMSPAFV